MSAKPWKRQLWKTRVYLVTIGMLIALLVGLNMSWTTLTTALALVVLDFKDAQPCLQKVESKSFDPTAFLKYQLVYT